MGKPFLFYARFRHPLGCFVQISKASNNGLMLENELASLLGLNVTSGLPSLSTTQKKPFFLWS